jgi:hypothetical protein
MVRVEGIEPPLMESKAIVLPLDDTRIKERSARPFHLRLGPFPVLCLNIPVTGQSDLSCFMQVVCLLFHSDGPSGD